MKKLLLGLAVASLWCSAGVASACDNSHVSILSAASMQSVSLVEPVAIRTPSAAATRTATESAADSSVFFAWNDSVLAVPVSFMPSGPVVPGFPRPCPMEPCN
jgi:hypothetical protein